MTTTSSKISALAFLTAAATTEDYTLGLSNSFRSRRPSTKGRAPQNQRQRRQDRRRAWAAGDKKAFNR